jgi:hypothetical protein
VASGSPRLYVVPECMTTGRYRNRGGPLSLKVARNREGAARTLPHAAIWWGVRSGRIVGDSETVASRHNFGERYHLYRQLISPVRSGPRSGNSAAYLVPPRGSATN